MSRLEEEFKAARDEVDYYRSRLHSLQQAWASNESEELTSLRRTVGELSETLEAEKAEVQQLKLQLVHECQVVRDAEAKSEVLRNWRRELEVKFERANRMYIDGLFKKKELEEEVLRLKQALVMAGADSSKSEEAGPF